MLNDASMVLTARTVTWPTLTTLTNKSAVKIHLLKKRFTAWWLFKKTPTRSNMLVLLWRIYLCILRFQTDVPLVCWPLSWINSRHTLFLYYNFVCFVCILPICCFNDSSVSRFWFLRQGRELMLHYKYIWGSSVCLWLQDMLSSFQWLLNCFHIHNYVHKRLFFKIACVNEVTSNISIMFATFIFHILYISVSGYNK